jgi:hypothetical protein
MRRSFRLYENTLRILAEWNQVVEFDRVIQNLECHMQSYFEVNIRNFNRYYFIHSTKRIVITLHLFNWMMCLNWDSFDRDSYVVSILLEFVNNQLLVCVDRDQIKWSQISVNLWNSQLISNMFRRDVFQSSTRLTSNYFVHYMKDELIIVNWFSFHIQYIYHNTVIKLNIFVSYWKDESFWEFVMHLTVMTKFREMLNCIKFNVIVFLPMKNFM